MSTAADLLAAVAAYPDDDTPRLVYADYLDDAGLPERAEFVRVQCARARLPDWDARARELRRRERVLLARYGRRWLAELGSVPGVEWGAFERGFVSEVRAATAADFVRAAAEVRASAPVSGVTLTTNAGLDPGAAAPELPWLTTVRLTDRDQFDAARLEALLQSPLAAHVRTLDLNGVGVENPGARAVAAATHLTRLEELDLGEGFVGVAGGAALAAARHLANLRVLRFDSHGSGYVDDPFLGVDGVRALVESPYLKNLTTLGLTGHATDAEAVRLVFTHPGFARLERVTLATSEFTVVAGEWAPTAARWQELDLTYCQLGTSDLAALLALPQLSELKRLRLTSAGVAAEGVAALAAAPAAAHLRELYLKDNYSGVGGAEALAAGNWPHLHTLDVSGNTLGPGGTAALARSAGLPALADLRAGDNEAGDAGAAALAAARWGDGLRRLDLGTNRIGPVGGRALAASTPLRRLERLDLPGNPVGADAVNALVAADWPGLSDLDLSGAGCGDAPVEALATAPLAGRLLRLSLDKCTLTPRAVAALVSGFAGGVLGELSLGYNPGLTAAGVEPFLGAEALPGLRVLNVAGCSLPSATVTALLRSPLGRRLARLQLWGNEYTQEAYREMMARAWGTLGPDWVDDGSEEEFPY